MGVIVRHTPAHNDAEVATLARSATVAQLRRAVSRYAFAQPGARPDAEPAPEPEPRRVGFGFDDDGTWRLTAVLPPDEGARFERALAVSRQALFAGDADHGDVPRVVSWADALVAVAEGYLASEAVDRPHRVRPHPVGHRGARRGLSGARL